MLHAVSTRQKALRNGRGSGGRLCGSYMARSMNLGDLCLAVIISCQFGKVGFPIWVE